MLNLKIYSLKELQSLNSILVQCKNKNISLDKLSNFIRQHVDYVVSNHKVVLDKPIKRKQSPQMPLCPSCEKARLEPVINYDGTHILGCKKCRYSEIQK